METVKGLIDGITGLIDDAMAAVEGINGITDVFGGSGEAVQLMYNRFRVAGMGFGEISSSISKLTKNSRNASDQVNEALESIGVNAMSTYASEWDYYQAVIEGLMAMEDQDAMKAAASALFGEK